MMSNTKSIGSNSVNEARATYFRTAIFTAQPAGQTGTNTLSTLGFTVGRLSIIRVPLGTAVRSHTFNNFSFGYPQSNMKSVDNNYMVTDTFGCDG